MSGWVVGDFLGKWASELVREGCCKSVWMIEKSVRRDKQRGVYHCRARAQHTLSILHSHATVEDLRAQPLAHVLTCTSLPAVMRRSQTCRSAGRRSRAPGLRCAHRGSPPACDPAACSCSRSLRTHTGTQNSSLKILCIDMRRSERR